MKITIRVTNAYPRAALDVHPVPPEPPPATAPLPKQKEYGGKITAEAAVGATSAAVAPEDLSPSRPGSSWRRSIKP